MTKMKDKYNIITFYNIYINISTLFTEYSTKHYTFFNFIVVCCYSFPQFIHTEIIEKK